MAILAGHHAAGSPPGPSLDHATSDGQALVAQALGRDDRRPRGPALEGLLHVQQHRGRAPPADVLDGRQRHAPPGVVLSAHAPHGMLRHAHAPARPTDGQPRTAGSESRQVPSAEEGVLVRGAQATSPLDDAGQGVHRTRAPAEVDPLHLATGGGAPARAPQGPGALAPSGVGLEGPEHNAGLRGVLTHGDLVPQQGSRLRTAQHPEGPDGDEVDVALLGSPSVATVPNHRLEVDHPCPLGRSQAAFQAPHGIGARDFQVGGPAMPCPLVDPSQGSQVARATAV